jgi:hypothetical protein
MNMAGGTLSGYLRKHVPTVISSRLRGRPMLSKASTGYRPKIVRIGSAFVFPLQPAGQGPVFYSPVWPYMVAREFPVGDRRLHQFGVYSEH